MEDRRKEKRTARTRFTKAQVIMQLR